MKMYRKMTDEQLKQRKWNLDAIQILCVALCTVVGMVAGRIGLREINPSPILIAILIIIGLIAICGWYITGNHMALIDIEKERRIKADVAKTYEQKIKEMFEEAK